jgi:DNA polymerase III subunit beta
MIIEIKREELLQPLASVTGVIEKKGDNPILSNVLIEIENNKVRTTASDSEIEQTATLNCKVDGNLKTTVNGKKMNDILKTLPENSIIKIIHDLNKERLEIKFGRSRFNLATIDVEHFPLMEGKKDGKKIEIETQEFLLAIKSTSLAMANQDIRTFLNGALLELKNGELTLVASDGHRMSIARMKIASQDQNFEVIIPRKTVMELEKMLSSEHGMTQITVNNGSVEFSTSNKQMISKLIDAKYADYEKVLPKYNDICISIDRSEFLKTLQRVSVLSNEKMKGTKFRFSENTMQITLNSIENDSAEESLDIEYNFPQLTIGFNVTYLIEYLNSVDTNEIRINLKDSDTSVIIEPLGNIEQKYVIMPMLIR